MDDAAVGPKIVSLEGDPEPALVAAVGAVRAGGVIVVPTDTVYGIAANAFDPLATREIFRIKRRPRSLPLPVLVSRPRQAWALCSLVPDAATALAGAFWPGALTMILPANTELEWDLGDGGDTLAVRMPHHPELLSLLERTGPLACTSANITGEPTPSAVSEIAEKLDGVALYVDGGASTLDHGSTIVDLTGTQPQIIREGPIGTQAVLEAIAAS